MGLSGQLDHPRVVEAVAAVAKASASRGKHAGIGGIGDGALLRRYIGRGLRFILSGNVFSFMMSAVRTLDKCGPSVPRTQPIKGEKPEWQS